MLSPKELRRLLAAAYAGRPRDGLLLRLLAESALRVAEAAHLDAAYVDVTERTVKVVRGKGDRNRVVFVTEDLAQLLRVHLAGRDRGPLFTSNRGTRLSVRRIQSLVQGAARRAGLPKRISPHAAAHVGDPRAQRRHAARQRPGPAGASRPETHPALRAAARARARQEYDTAMRAIAGGGTGA